MPLTVDEILAHENALQTEIAEKQALLTAYQLLRAHTAGGGTALPVSPLGAMVPPALNFVPALPAPPPVNIPAPPKPYIHPELEAIRCGHGNNGRIVSWAINRMTDNYSLADLAQLLEREGRPMLSPEISVVLSRLKSRGEIKELAPGRGRIGAIFQKPESATPPQTEPAEQTRNATPLPALNADS